MSELSNAPLTLRSLSTDFIDGISEAIAWSPDPPARSAAICDMIYEVYETAVWLHGGNEQDRELASLRKLVSAAQAHQQRMGISRADEVAG